MLKQTSGRSTEMSAHQAMYKDNLQPKASNFGRRAICHTLARQVCLNFLRFPLYNSMVVNEGWFVHREFLQNCEITTDSH